VSDSDCFVAYPGYGLTDVAVIMGIMMVLAFLKHRNLKSNLLRVFYRDGIYYFVLLSSQCIVPLIHSETRITSVASRFRNRKHYNQCRVFSA
jgi:hypothetical protein